MPKGTPDPPPDHTPGKQVSEESKAWFYKQVRAGRNPYKVGSQLGISRHTSRRLMNKAAERWADSKDLTPRKTAQRVYEAAEGKGVEGDLSLSGEFPDPIVEYEQLGPRAKQAYRELGYFRTRYLHRRNISWQLEMCHILLSWFDEAQERDERVRGIVNTPPGGGKTTTVTHDFPAWLIARNRAIRIALGARATSQSTRYIAIAHPADPLPFTARLALAVGLVLFLGGVAAAVWRAHGKILVGRSVLALVTALVVLVWTPASVPVLLLVVVLGVVAIAVYEQIFDRAMVV